MKSTALPIRRSQHLGIFARIKRLHLAFRKAHHLSRKIEDACATGHPLPASKTIDEVDQIATLLTD